MTRERGSQRKRRTEPASKRFKRSNFSTCEPKLKPATKLCLVVLQAGFLVSETVRGVVALLFVLVGSARQLGCCVESRNSGTPQNLKFHR